MRHGLAGDRERWQGDDFVRPLTDEGRTRMGREAKTIKALDLELDEIVTSPLTRAKQTAEIVAETLRIRDRLVEDARVGLEFDEARLSALLESRKSANALMFVGHEPSMSATLGGIIGGGRVDLKKGGLARIDLSSFAPLGGRLVWLIPPSVLSRP